MYMFLLWYIFFEEIYNMCDKWVLLYMNFFSFGIYVFLILNFMLKVFLLRVIRIKCDYLIIISICFIDIVVIYVYSFE